MQVCTLGIASSPFVHVGRWVVNKGRSRKIHVPDPLSAFVGMLLISLSEVADVRI